MRLYRLKDVSVYSKYGDGGYIVLYEVDNSDMSDDLLSGLEMNMLNNYGFTDTWDDDDFFVDYDHENINEETNADLLRALDAYELKRKLNEFLYEG